MKSWQLKALPIQKIGRRGWPKSDNYEDCLRSGKERKLKDSYSYFSGNLRCFSQVFEDAGKNN